MAQLNFTELNSIFEIIIHKYITGLMIDGKLVWLQEEDPNEDISIALIIWEELSISELFKDILEAISLIHTLQDNVLIGTGIFPCIYHVGCTFNLYSIINNGLVLGGQILSRRQCSSCLLIQEMKVTKTQSILTSQYHVSRDTCTVHGRDVKTRYFWVDILILRSMKD